jgi:hypothetical protein
MLLLVFCNTSAWAQVDTAGVDTVVIDSTVVRPVSILPSRGITGSQSQPEKKLFKVVPWEFHAPLGADLIETDSTMRWQGWPDWSYKLNLEPGVISYRLGTSIRSNAVQQFAHAPAQQQLYWEDILLNDPVSGTLHWSEIPQHKIGSFYSQDLGTKYRSTYYLRQYYLNKPLTRLIYSESSYSKRDLEFEVSHNLSQRTNIELSYWDRRTGGEYPNSTITGRQIYAKISHHLSKNQYLKLNYINNNYNIGQPFGYSITDLRTFNFDRYRVSASEPSANSRERTSLLALHFYKRSKDSTQAIDNFHAGLYYRGNERIGHFNSDSTQYKLRTLGVSAKKWWTTGGVSLDGTTSYEYFFNQVKNEGFPRSTWSLLKTEGRVLFDFTSIIDLEGAGAFHLRSDGFQSYRLNATSDISIGGFTLSPGVTVGSTMPTLQELYWDSEGYSGNPDLFNEKVREAHASITFSFTSEAKIGIRAQHKDITDGIMFVGSTFSNVGSYASQSATAFLEWDVTHFEFNGSATLHRFTDSYSKPSGLIPMSPRKKVWLKGGAYWKGYLFGRATYVKAGLSGMMSPFRYQADHYNPVLDTWQSASDDQLLPVFNRLDVDISARLRWIMFSLRWENVLDDVNQLGYFETAQYPMAGRRFIFGVRAFFRN